MHPEASVARRLKAAEGELHMITVSIGKESRSGTDITESWVNQQINRRLRDGSRVCVTVTVNTQDLDMVLRTSDCPKPRRAGRAPNAKEWHVFDLWDKLDLQDGEVRGGKVVAFLKQMGEL